MSRIISSLILLFLQQVLYSQAINIENKRFYEDTNKWSGNLDVSFYAMQTKDPLWGFRLKPQVQYKDSLNTYLLVADLNQSKGKNVTFASTGMIHFRYAYRLDDGPVKWESYVQSQFNKLLMQKHRSIIGTGLRWKFFDTDDRFKYNRQSLLDRKLADDKLSAKFFYGTSLMYEYEEINPNNTNIYFNNRLRLSYYTSWFLKKKDMYSFGGTVYYQPVLAHFSSYRLTTNFELKFKMSSKTEFKFDMMFYYDSKPAPEVRNWIYNTNFGLVYKFI